jgi:hypothetical protein
LLVQVQDKVLQVDTQMERMDVLVVEEHKLLVVLLVPVVLAVVAAELPQEVFYKVVKVQDVMEVAEVVVIMAVAAVREIVDHVRVQLVVEDQAIIIQL